MRRVLADVTLTAGSSGNPYVNNTSIDGGACNGTDPFVFDTPQALLDINFVTKDERVFRNSGFDFGSLGSTGSGGPQPMTGAAGAPFSSHTAGTFASTTNRLAYDIGTSLGGSLAVASAIPHQYFAEDQSLTYRVPADTFTGSGGYGLAYSATLATGGSLPTWLQFDEATQKFSGTPPTGYTGTLAIKVTANDGIQSASDTFDVTVQQITGVPYLAHQLADHTIGANKSFGFTLPANAFADTSDPHLNYSATLANGGSLPPWLTFDAATLTFSGKSPVGFNGSRDLRVTASDGVHTASDDFLLTQLPEFQYHLTGYTWGANAPSVLDYTFNEFHYAYSATTKSVGFNLGGSFNAGIADISGGFDGSIGVAFQAALGPLVHIETHSSTYDVNYGFNVKGTTSTAAQAIDHNPWIVATGEVAGPTTLVSNGGSDSNNQLQVEFDAFVKLDLVGSVGVYGSISVPGLGSTGFNESTSYDVPIINIDALPIHVDLQGGDTAASYSGDYGSLSFGIPGTVSTSTNTVQTPGASGLGALQSSGLSSPFLSGNVDFGGLLGALVPELKPFLSGDIPFPFPLTGPGYGTGIHYTTFGAQLDGEATLEESFSFQPVIDVTATTSFGQTVTGQGGEKLQFNTPEGVGTFTVEETYKSFATLRTQIAVHLDAAFSYEVLAAYLYAKIDINLGVYDFKKQFDSPTLAALQGSIPLGGIDIPIHTYTRDVTLGGSDQQFFTLSYEKFRTVQGSGDNFTLTPHQRYAIGNGDANTLIANNLGDTILGEGGNNVLVGGTGNDALSSGDGNNYIRDTAGVNKITLGNGRNRIVVGKSSDTIKAGNGDNYITGTGPDTVRVGSGDNTITLGNAGESVTAGGGNNAITVGDGNDSITAGSGTNTITIKDASSTLQSFSDDQITVGSGDNVITAGDNQVTIVAGYGSNTISLGNNNDTITAKGGSDNIIAGYGNDTITLGNASGDGSNRIKLGNGNDTITVVQVAYANDLGFDGKNTIVVGNGKDRIIGGDGNDSITAGGGGDYIDGGSGNDFINGRAGNATIIGGRGDDTIVGGPGDTLYGDPIDINTITSYDLTQPQRDTFVFAPGCGQNTIWDLNSLWSTRNVSSTSQSNLLDTIDLTAFHHLRSLAGLVASPNPADGSIVLHLDATDSIEFEGVYTQADWDNIVKPTPFLFWSPTVASVAVASDKGSLGDTVKVTGMADAGTTLKLFDGGTVVGDVNVGTNGTWSITTTPLAIGAHSLSARETDSFGNQSAPSAALSLRIDRGTPNGAAFVGSPGTSRYTGGGGNDTFQFSTENLTSADIVNGGAGSDTLMMTDTGVVNAAGVSGVENYVLTGGGPNQLTLRDANFAGVTGQTITVTGGNGGDTLSAAGLSPSDHAILIGGGGGDTFIAGLHTTMTETASVNPNRFEFTTPGTAATPDNNVITNFSEFTDVLVFSDLTFNLGIDEGKGTSTPQTIDQSLFSSHTNGTFDTPNSRFAYDTSTGGLYYDAGGSSTPAARQLVGTLAGHPLFQGEFDIQYIR